MSYVNGDTGCGSAAKATTANRIKTITGVLQHPNCRGRAGVPFPQALAPWVGIDGARAQNSILQAGTTCAVDDTSGKVNNFVWMQWLPANSMMVNNFPVKAGDFVKVTIETSSTTSAKMYVPSLLLSPSYLLSYFLTFLSTYPHSIPPMVGRCLEINLLIITCNRTMENLSQGYANVLRLSNSPTPISGIDAVWLIESPVLNGQIVKLPKYDELWIQEASATLMDGKKLGILGALQYQMTGQCKSQEYGDSTVSFTFP